MGQYLVSVRLMTYNHEKYIAKCLEGILEQQTDFNFEVVIGDDFSTDQTVSIIKQYTSTEKIHIKLLERKLGGRYETKRKQLGRLYNFVDIIYHCTGKYIATIDGDDYWTDPFKLQKQVNFMEANPDFSQCFTNTLVRNNDTGEERIAKTVTAWNVADTSALLDHHDYNIKNNDLVAQGHTSSMLFRNGLIEFPEWYFKCSIGDLPLVLLLSKYGKAKFLNEVTGVYLVHPNGISVYDFSKLHTWLGRIFIYKMINKYHERKYSKQIHGMLSKYYITVSKIYYKKANYLDTSINLLKAYYYKYTS